MASKFKTVKLPRRVTKTAGKRQKWISHSGQSVKKKEVSFKGVKAQLWCRTEGGAVSSSSDPTSVYFQIVFQLLKENTWTFSFCFSLEPSDVLRTDFSLKNKKNQIFLLNRSPNERTICPKSSSNN